MEWLILLVIMAIIITITVLIIMVREIDNNIEILIYKLRVMHDRIEDISQDVFILTITPKDEQCKKH